jgi:hypothetical protein
VRLGGIDGSCQCSFRVCELNHVALFVLRFLRTPIIPFSYITGNGNEKIILAFLFF